MKTTGATLLLLAVLAPGLTAQPNTVANLDAQLFVAEHIRQAGRTGAFPNGRNGLTIGVEICNTGTVDIDWRAPMDPRHPFYAFIVCRESDGRFMQISDRSYVKHGFSSINQNNCGTCFTFQSNRLGPNCSDVYDTFLNGDRFWLGPADEVDPWLGAWNPVGSHFDKGEPEVSAPQNSDGNRSLTRAMANALGPIAHRVEVDDQELSADGQFFYGSHAIVTGEAESLRHDNMVSREVTVNWTGSNWNFNDQPGVSFGSILQHWSGADLNSNSNGSDDGRFYVAVVVTGPDSRGLWHYEYAVHNRDNSRGAASLRIPICPPARVMNAGFRDIDNNASNDWNVSVGGGEVVFATVSAAALEWNTIYNFWFDSDAEPQNGSVSLDQARPGAGAATVSVNSKVPSIVHTEYIGDGCGNPAPTLWPAGSPPYASIGNATFRLEMDGLQPGAAAVFFLSPFPENLDLGNGCTLLFGLPPFLTGSVIANGSGVATVFAPVPNVPTIEGLSMYTQAAEVFPGGPLFGDLNMSNGLRVRIGNSLTPCP